MGAPFVTPLAIQKKGFRCSFAHQHCGRNATKLITASIKSPLKTNILLFQFCITIASCATQFFFNANQLVVFRHTVSAAHRTGLNLS